MRSPGTASPRTDLPFLRRRALPKAAPAAAPVAAAPVAGGSSLSDFIAGRSSRTGSSSPTPPPQAPPVSAGSGLDLGLSAPSAPPAPTPPPASGGSGLDLGLSAPAPSPAAPASAGLGLDLNLSEPAPQPPAARAAAAPTRLPPQVRVAPGQRMVLNQDNPTMTLNRVQSGVGALEFEAAWSQGHVGDLRLGCAYQLRTGTSTMQLSAGRGHAPAGAASPVLLAMPGDFEKIVVDLRQVRELERMVIYAVSESGAPVQWGGTLLTRTHAQSRIEIPLESMAEGNLAVIASVYNVAGELVLRAEQWTTTGTIRDACLAFGFDTITWLDGQTPIE